MATFKYALFDLDGTLFDTEGQYSNFWGEIGRRYHPEIPRFEHIIKGTTLKQIYERYFPDPELQAVINPQLIEFESQMQYIFFPGALEFIQDIRRNGVKTAVVTSSDQKKMSNVYRKVAEFGNLFDKVFTAEDFKASKPDPDCYLCAARYFNAAKDECIVFEDAFTGLQAGMASGIYTIGVASGLTPEQIKDKCHHVILSFKEIDYQAVNGMLSKI